MNGSAPMDLTGGVFFPAGKFPAHPAVILTKEN